MLRYLFNVRCTLFIRFANCSTSYTVMRFYSCIPLSVKTVLAYAPLVSMIAYSFRPGSVCTRPTTDSIVAAATNLERLSVL